MPTVTKRQPRTYRIVGPQQKIDDRDSANIRIDRGELGERLRLWRKNRFADDPLKLIFGAGHDMKGGPSNSFGDLLRNRPPETAVSPHQIPVSDPTAMARKIKEVARFLGADVVGITQLDQAYVYSHRGSGIPADGERPGDPIHLPHKYAICLGFAFDYNRSMTNNSSIADAEYDLGLKNSTVPTLLLAAYIREMGYPARAQSNGRYEVNPVPLAVNAGLGELGRNGILINEEYGPRLHLAAVTTDLPLTVDEPVDIGVEDVCKICMKCAQTCPTYSIPFGGKVVINGVEKWAINVQTCYRSRLTTRCRWIHCLYCISSCCYNKRSSWWHTLAVLLLKKIPIPLRLLYIKPLLLIDDLIWGKKVWRHMKWMDYDNTPVPVTCNIPGCIAKHSLPEHKRLHKVPAPKAKLIATHKRGN